MEWSFGDVGCVYEACFGRAPRNRDLQLSDPEKTDWLSVPRPEPGTPNGVHVRAGGAVCVGRPKLGYLHLQLYPETKGEWSNAFFLKKSNGDINFFDL